MAVSVQSTVMKVMSGLETPRSNVNRMAHGPAQPLVEVCICSVIDSICKLHSEFYTRVRDKVILFCGVNCFKC